MSVCVSVLISISHVLCVYLYLLHPHSYSNRTESLTHTPSISPSRALSLSLARSLSQIGSYGFFELAWTLDDEQSNPCIKCGCEGEYLLLISRDVSDTSIADVRGSVTVLDSMYQHYPDNKQVPYTRASYYTRTSPY